MFMKSTFSTYLTRCKKKTGLSSGTVSYWRNSPYPHNTRPVGQASSVGIDTRYRLDGRSIESRRLWDFPHLPRPVLGPIQPPLHLAPAGLRSGKAVGGWSKPLSTMWWGRWEWVEPYFHFPNRLHGVLLLQGACCKCQCKNTAHRIAQ